MRVCAISDLHGYLPPQIPECDVLLIAGDICSDWLPGAWDPDLMRMEQRNFLREDFAAWEKTVPAERILCTPGNHDWFTSFPDGLRAELFIDELVEWKGKRFYFTPWTNIHGDWNFQLSRDQLRLRFADIPRNLDVLVSHMPPHNCLDTVYGGDHAGCPELRQAVQNVRPKVMVCGHIHEGQRYGKCKSLGQTTVYNVSKWGDWSPTSFELV